MYVEPSLLEPGFAAFKEDLLQVKFSDNLLLDVGWYGSEQQGFFRVVMIRDAAWDLPVFSEICTDLPGTIDAVERAVAFSAA